MSNPTKADLQDMVDHMRANMGLLIASHRDLVAYASGKVHRVDLDWSRKIQAMAETARFEPLSRKGRGPLDIRQL